MSKHQTENNPWWIFDGLKKGNQPSEKDAMKKGFLDNYGYFLALGGLYMAFPGNWLIPCSHLTIGVTHIFFFIYTAYLCLDDFGMLSECLHNTGFLFLICSIQVNGLMQRESIKKFMRLLGGGVYSYETTMDDETNNLVNEATKETKYFKNLYSKMFVIFVGSAAFTVSIVRPLGIYLTRNVEVENFDGINRYVPVHCWYPLDSRAPLNVAICFFIQYCLIVTTVLIVYGLDVLFFCMSEELILHLKIVSINMRNIIKRAKYLMKKRQETDIKNALGICLNESVKHHNAVIRLFDNYQEYNYYILFLMVSGAALLLCLCGVMFISNEVALLSKATFFFFLTGQATHIFIICWYGERIKQASANIGQEIYNSEWSKYVLIMKGHMFMIMPKGVRPLTVTCGGFMEASMETYSNVLSSAYSYFNLLNAAH